MISTGNALKQRCLSFTIIVFGLLFTLSTGVMPYMVGGGYTYVNHSVSCQPDDGSSGHRVGVHPPQSYVFYNMTLLGSAKEESDLGKFLAQWSLIRANLLTFIVCFRRQLASTISLGVC